MVCPAPGPAAVTVVGPVLAAVEKATVDAGQVYCRLVATA